MKNIDFNTTFKTKDFDRELISKKARQLKRFTVSGKY